MAMTVTRLKAIVGADTSPAEKKLRGFGNFAKQTLSTALGFAVAQGGAALVRGFTGMVREGLQATATFERMKMSLTALAAKEIKSAHAGMSMTDALAAAKQLAAELFQWAKKLAIQSPFSAEGVVNTMRTAIAYGFTSKQAKTLTQAMIDFASATGASEGVMNQVALALGQIKAKGHLAGQELLQLVNAGVPVNDILGDMGYTLDDVSKGLVDSKSFMEAFTKYMDENFGGAAKRQAESWAGLMNTFDDLKKQGLAAFFKGLLEAIKPFVTAFADWLQGPGLAKLQAWGKALGNFANDAIAAFGGLKALLAGDFSKLSGVLYKFGAPKWVRESVMDLASKLGRLKDTVRGLFSGKLDFGGLAGKANPVLKFFSSLKDVFHLYGPKIAAQAKATLQRVWEALQGAFEDAKERIGPWVDDLLGTITDWFAEYGPVLAEAAQNLMRWWGEAAQNLMRWFGAAFSFLASQVGPVLDVVLPILKGFVDVFLGIVATIAQVINGDWSGAWATLKQTAAKALADLWKALTELFDLVLGWLGTSWPQFLAMWKGIWGQARFLVAHWKDVVALLWQALWDSLKAKLSNAWAGMKLLWAKAQDAITTKVQEWIGGLKKKWDGMKRALTNTLQEMVQAVQDKVSDMKAKGKAFIQGLWDGIKEKVEGLIAYLQDKLGAILDLLDKIWGISSPSKEMRKRGQFLMEGLRQGLEVAYRGTNWAQYFSLGGASLALAGAGGAGGGIGVVNIHIDGAQDPEAVAREVMRALRLNGLAM